VPPPQVHIFDPNLIRRGPDEIRGSIGSHAFIFTKYLGPQGNRWFLQPGYIGHEMMTNTPEMLQAFFGPEAMVVARQVVTIGDACTQDERGFFIATGEKRMVWDWWTIRQLAKRENLFGRAGRLCGREVVMLWGTPPGWEAMVGEVLKHLGIGPQNDAVVVVRNSAQYMARDFCGLDGDDGAGTRSHG
jgi:hypothetical protein